MKCPHCRVEFADDPQYVDVGEDVDGDWVLVRRECAACKRIVLHLANCTPIWARGVLVNVSKVVEERMVKPEANMRPPPPVEVPEKLAEDYVEACLVLPESPKASAALSRRCLQNLLREVAKVKPGNLADEIQYVIDNKTLPAHIAEAVDAVRNIGKFRTHPIKSEKTGEILPVESGEAEWNLDVLESLFDLYFVQPEVLRKKRAKVERRIEKIGRGRMDESRRKRQARMGKAGRASRS